jgi:hypothetical protein
MSMAKMISHTASSLVPVREFPHVRMNVIAFEDLLGMKGQMGALEVVCSAGCVVPETCFHVRAALAHGADIETIALLETHCASIHIRIPLANRLWVRGIIRPRSGASWHTDPDVVEFNGPIVGPILHFTLEGRGIEDIKWLLVNHAGAMIDDWKYNQVAESAWCPECERCGEVLDTADISAEPDFAWVVAWRKPEQFCYNCTRKQAAAWYRNRASLADVSMSPINKDW